jgi:hypothetical protein
MADSSGSKGPRPARSAARGATLRLEAAMAFLVLAVIISGEIALIRHSRHSVPLSQATQLVLRLTFGR